MASYIARLFLLVAFFLHPSFILGFNLLQAGADDAIEERACTPATASFHNAGFESKKLKPWTWSSTNHSTPAIARIVKAGYKSHRSVDLYTRVVPWAQSPSGRTENNGRLRQTIKICKEGHYRVSWAYYQVPGATNYDDEITDWRAVSAFMITNKGGHSDWLNEFYLYKTYSTCQFCDNISKKYPAGKWYQFSGTFYAYEPGMYTVMFRTEVFAGSRDEHDVETRVRIDNVNIKRIGAA